MEEQSPEKPKDPFESAKTAVLKEMMDYIKTDPIRGYNNYFQNFHLRLPQQGSVDEVTFRQQQIKYWKTDSEKYSDKRKQATGEDYFKDVDEAIAASKISVENIRSLKEAYRANPDNTLALTSLNMLTIDAFIRLRMKGYNRTDLTA